MLRKLCIEMGFPQHSPTIIYEDCEAAVALSKETRKETRFRKRRPASGSEGDSETRFRRRSKHIALRWYCIAERQAPQIGDTEHALNSETTVV